MPGPGCGGTNTIQQQQGVYARECSFLRVTFVHGPWRVARDWRCTATQAATLATSLHHSALRGQKKAQGPGGGKRVELHGEVPEDSSSPAGSLQLVRRRARREAACQPGRAAGAAGADPAAHRGTASRTCSHGADPRRSCAADSGPGWRTC